MNFTKYRVQLSTEKKYSSKYEYKYEYSIPGRGCLVRVNATTGVKIVNTMPLQFYIIFGSYHELTCCEETVWILISRFLQKPADLAGSSLFLIV